MSDLCLNCLPHGATLSSFAEEMGGFLSVEIDPVAANADPDTGETCCDVTTPDKADFWTVYARYDCDGDKLAVALHDEGTREDAERVARDVASALSIPAYLMGA